MRNERNATTISGWVDAAMMSKKGDKEFKTEYSVL